MSYRHQFSPPILPALFAGMIGFSLFFLSMLGWLNNQLSFVLITLLLLVYLWAEINRLRRIHPEAWLLNPVVLASFLTFGLGYGFTNILYFLPEDLLSLKGVVPGVTPAMVKLMWLVLVAAIAMWVGYWSPFAARCSRGVAIRRFQLRFLPGSLQPKFLAIPILLMISVMARLIQVRLGLFGYSSSYEQLIAYASITQYLGLAVSLGKLALVLAAIQFYMRGSSHTAKWWLFACLGSEVVFGVLSGFKSQVAMPFIIVGVCQYLLTGKVRKKWIIMFVIALPVAYTIVQPLRVALNMESSSQSVSIESIASMAISSVGSDQKLETNAEPGILLSIAARSNLSYIGSFGIEFSDTGQTSSSGSPHFLEDIFLAPLHAWIPRFIWDSKPLGTLGLWYNQVVMGMSHFSSTAMGPITYLYFAGGGIAVFLGFFFLGVVQRVLFFLLQPVRSSAGAVVFLGMLTTLVIIDSAYNGILVTLFRELPLLLLIQFFIFGGRKRKKCKRLVNHPPMRVRISH